MFDQIPRCYAKHFLLFYIWRYCAITLFLFLFRGIELNILLSITCGDIKFSSLVFPLGYIVLSTLLSSTLGGHSLSTPHYDVVLYIHILCLYDTIFYRYYMCISFVWLRCLTHECTLSFFDSSLYPIKYTNYWGYIL